ncbi:hypothetical protein PUN4_740020 [Paraburkholderia unamae]|nr:hypothetical protein PUN4_740020 [Paraburkholderia unamae]
MKQNTPHDLRNFKCMPSPWLCLVTGSKSSRGESKFSVDSPNAFCKRYANADHEHVLSANVRGESECMTLPETSGPFVYVDTEDTVSNVNPLPVATDNLRVLLTGKLAGSL